MEVTFLGTGNARGIPTYGCQCAICEQARHDTSLKRNGLCHFVQNPEGSGFVLDAGRFDLPQLLESNLKLQEIVISHFHPDHIYGLLPLSWGRGEKIKVYAPPDPTGYGDLYQELLLDFIFLEEFRPFQIGEFNLTPIPLPHGNLTFGYAIESQERKLAYLCDCCGLFEETRSFLESWQPDTIIIDANQHPDNPNKSHNTITGAIDIAKELKANQVYLTHLSCSGSAWLHAHTLPDSVYAAYDSLIINI